MIFVQAVNGKLLCISFLYVCAPVHACCMTQSLSCVKNGTKDEVSHCLNFVRPSTSA